MYGFDHGVWMLGSWIVMLVVWLLPFVLLYLGIRSLVTRVVAPGDRNALDMLAEAYAGGKISRDEFLQKRIDLQYRLTPPENSHEISS